MFLPPQKGQANNTYWNSHMVNVFWKDHSCKAAKHYYGEEDFEYLLDSSKPSFVPMTVYT